MLSGSLREMRHDLFAKHPQVVHLAVKTVATKTHPQLPSAGGGDLFDAPGPIVGIASQCPACERIVGQAVGLHALGVLARSLHMVVQDVPVDVALDAPF